MQNRQQKKHRKKQPKKRTKNKMTLKEKIALADLQKKFSRGIISQTEYDLRMKFGNKEYEKAKKMITDAVDKHLPGMRKAVSEAAAKIDTSNVDHTDRIDTERVKKKRELQALKEKQL